MVRVRKWIAVGLVGAGTAFWLRLAVFGWMADGAPLRVGVLALAPLGLLMATLVGVARQRWWGRWLGLGVGLTWSTIAARAVWAAGDLLDGQRAMVETGSALALGLL